MGVQGERGGAAWAPWGVAWVPQGERGDPGYGHRAPRERGGHAGSSVGTSGVALGHLERGVGMPGAAWVPQGRASGPQVWP